MGCSKVVVGVFNISIDVPKLLGMLVGAWLLLGRRRRHVPAEPRGCVSLRLDNAARVTWIQRCRGGQEPRLDALMRLLGVIEGSSGWYFHTSHVSGVLNSTADGIYR